MSCCNYCCDLRWSSNDDPYSAWQIHLDYLFEPQNESASPEGIPGNTTSDSRHNVEQKLNKPILSSWMEEPIEKRIVKWLEDLPPHFIDESILPIQPDIIDIQPRPIELYSHLLRRHDSSEFEELASGSVARDNRRAERTTGRWPPSDGPEPVIKSNAAEQVFSGGFPATLSTHLAILRAQDEEYQQEENESRDRRASDSIARITPSE